MSKSLIQTANQSTQTVAVNSIIAPGAVQRRFGCNLRLSGNAIEAVGAGYYTIDAAVSVAPTEAGPASVALFVDGVQLPGAIAYGTTAAAGDVATLPIVATTRLGCCGDSSDTLTLVLLEGEGTVENVSLRVEKA